MFWDTPQGIALMVLLVVAVLVFLWVKGYKSLVKKIVLALVIQAEKALGSGTGEFKYAMVLAWIYERIPAVLQFLFTEKQIDEMIEWAVQEMKRRLQGSEVLAQSFTSQLPN